jgi:hypothetical protein
VVWLAADLMVGVEERFVEKSAHVAAAQSIHDPLSVTRAFDQAGQSQL